MSEFSGIIYKNNTRMFVIIQLKTLIESTFIKHLLCTRSQVNKGNSKIIG